MGGDEVYPTASRKAYKERTRAPYEAAFPDSTAGNAAHPRLFAIPGNHDWYDGLEAFVSTFCRFRDRPPHHGGLSIGSWRCRQTRSYFALKLTEDCWLWGLDIQLEGYVDQPQVNYFRLMAGELSKNARVIICTAQPSWLKAGAPNDREYESLNYIAELVDRAKGDQKAFLLIAGDIHHYSRYTEPESGMQFITAGGGGAFLHPTHQLKSQLKGNWLDHQVTLHLARDAADHDKPACYPQQSTSRRLLWGNLAFVFRNWDFCLALGTIYVVLAASLPAGDLGAAGRLLSGPSGSVLGAAGSLLHDIYGHTWSWFVTAILVITMWIYAKTPDRVLRTAVGVLHGAVHLAILLALATVFRALNADWLGLGPYGPLSYAVLFVEMVPAVFLLAGLVWGLYLSLTCALFAMHTNDSFSAMRIEGYKNFLRIRIKGDEITVYPIGLETVPRDENWTENGAAPPAPVLVPKSPLEPHLIEAPIVIRSAAVKRIA